VLKGRICVSLSLGFLALPSAAIAGAWTLPEGSGLAIIAMSASSATKAFGGLSVPRYNKVELQGLLEYGITNRLTFIFSPGLQHIDIGSPVDAKRTGLGYTEIGGRYLLWQNSSWVFSAQATGRIPGTSDTSNPAAIGYTSYEADVRALLGHSFKLGGMPSFIDIQVAQRFAASGAPSEFRTDLTFGVRTSDRWLWLAQSFNVMSEGSAGWAYGSYEYYKLQLSGVYSITPALGVQAGAFTTYWGRNALQENGGVLGLWYKF
jgi:protein XagA